MLNKYLLRSEIMSNKALFIIALILIFGIFAFWFVQNNSDNSGNSYEAYDRNFNQTTSIENNTEKS